MRRSAARLVDRVLGELAAREGDDLRRLEGPPAGQAFLGGPPEPGLEAWHSRSYGEAQSKTVRSKRRRGMGPASAYGGA
jgi:hypothetical protein